MSIYIYLNLLMWLCAYLCLCVGRACMHTQTHTPLVCLSAPVTVFVCLRSCWNGTWTFCRWAEFTETGLVLACRAVFRLCIYASDNHSNLYHRLVIHVCLLCSVLIRFHQEVAPLPFYLVPLKLFPQKCSRHTRSEFHQPPVIGADQAPSGFP